MKRLISLTIILLIFALPVCAMLRDGTDRVFDDCGLFTDEEKQALEEKVTSMRDLYGMDFVVLTADVDTNGTSEVYAEDFYDREFDSDGIIYFIDMYNRLFTTSSCNEMTRYITDYRDEDIRSVALNELSDGYYYDAVVAALDRTAMYMEEGIPENQHNVDENGNVDYYNDESSGVNSFIIGVIVISAIVGAIAALIFYFSVKKSYSLKGSTYEYNVSENTEYKIIKGKDDYIRSSVSRTRKESSNNSDSGTTSVHTSSGGNTHSGGSSSF